MPDPGNTHTSKRHRNAAPYKLREWSRRALLVIQVLEMRQAGQSLNDAARATGEPIANLSRYVRAFRAMGVDGLMPDVGTGRTSAAANIRLTQEEARHIAALSLRVIRRLDIAAACRAFAAHPDCRPELRATITGRIPKSVRDAIIAALPPIEK